MEEIELNYKQRSYRSDNAATRVFSTPNHRCKKRWD